MINKALLDPWVRCKLKDLQDFLFCNNVVAVVSSGFRDTSEQTNLFNQCLDPVRGTKFPVKHPGCSQHEHGLAFDLDIRPLHDPRFIGQFGALKMAICAVRPDLFFCARKEQDPHSLAGDYARAIGLNWSASDPVHFSAFPSAVFNSHMEALGFNCQTCRPGPGGVPASFFDFRIPDPSFFTFPVFPTI